MARYKSRTNTPISFFTLLFFSYFIVVGTLISAALLSGNGTVLDMLGAVLEVLPFGHFFLELAGLVCSTFNSAAANTAELLQNGTLYSSHAIGLDWVKEVCKLILSAGLNAALYASLCVFLGLNRKGFWISLKKLVIMMLSAYLAAFASGMVLTFLFNQLSSVPNWISNLTAGVVSLAIIGAVFYIMCILFLGKGSLVMFIIYFAVRYVLLGIVRVGMVYVAILVLLLLIQSGSIAASAAWLSGVGLLLILLAAIDLMLGTAFGFDT